MKQDNTSDHLFHNFFGRRDFLTTLTKTMGTSLALAAPGLGLAKDLWKPQATFTVGQVIDLILKEIPEAPLATTVDTLKSGTREQKVTGIVTTTFPTVAVIQKTIKAGANLIIVHEPTYYNGQDNTDWLEQDEVYQQKRDLLKQNNIAVWRFHDYWHRHRPDGILMGVLTALGWDNYYDPKNPRLITLPPTPLKNIVAHTKQKLGIPSVRVIGDLNQVCSRIALSPGAAGGRSQITLLQQIKPDLFITGEVSEWETSERIRDGQQLGQKTSLLILGHAVSEEAGMEYLVKWLQPKVPGIKITHIPAQNPFTWV